MKFNVYYVQNSTFRGHILLRAFNCIKNRIILFTFAENFTMSWLEKLESRWNVNRKQVIIILIVFACTGFTIMFLKKPIVAYFAPDGQSNTLFTILYYILILPVYNMFLLFYGFIFGQFNWFWEFEKRFFRRMIGRKS